MCDCDTGYIVDFIIYTGAQSDIRTFDEDIGKSGNIVMTLMQPYLDSGHTLYLDNWDRSPLLFTLLHNRQTHACATARANRKYLPKMKEKLEVGQVVFYTTSNLLALKWRDKRDVMMVCFVVLWARLATIWKN